MAAIRLVIGLGNPGSKYAGTRHNVGFMLVDRLASDEGIRWESYKGAPGEIARGSSFWLAKPMTFMNDSGEFVQPFCHFYKIAAADVFVCYDDVALPFGKLRIRKSGSAGGHNGMKSIIQHLGTDAFARLRIGVGQPPGVDSAHHVLQSFSKTESGALSKILDDAAAAVQVAASEGIETAMNRYNRDKDSE